MNQQTGRDEIELCSKDSSSLLRKSEIRKTFAACDRCGQVLCRQHIKMMDGHYFCDEHVEYMRSAKLDNSTSSRFDAIMSKES
jgi:late competence protein required for DNA uptake (superfamily II DNA/RNA helicase)